MISAKGINGTVVFDGKIVRIERTGFNARMTQGTGGKQFPLSAIAAVQVVKPGMTRQGYFQISAAGDSSAQGRRASSALAKDENTILVNRKQFPEFQAVADQIVNAQASS